LLRGAEEIPFVAVEIFEYCNLPVRFGSGRRQELDTGLSQARVRRVEVIHAQEESYAPGELSTD
jgi:hypothetical protein